MRRLGYGVIRSKNIAEKSDLENSKSRYGCEYQFTSSYCDPHTCTHLSRMNENSACAIDKVYKGKMKKT
jgi:hypothetical protein